MTGKQLKDRLHQARTQGRSVVLTMKQLEEIAHRLEGLELYKQNIQLAKKQWNAVHAR